MTDVWMSSDRVYQAFLFGRMPFLLQVASSITLSLIKNYLFYQCHVVHLQIPETVAGDVEQLSVSLRLFNLSQCSVVRVPSFMKDKKKKIPGRKALPSSSLWIPYSGLSRLAHLICSAMVPCSNLHPTPDMAGWKNHCPLLCFSCCSWKPAPLQLSSTSMQRDLTSPPGR